MRFSKPLSACFFLGDAFILKRFTRQVVDTSATGDASYPSSKWVEFLHFLDVRKALSVVIFLKNTLKK